MDDAFVKPYPSVVRWFTTCVGQPEFLAVLGPTKLKASGGGGAAAAPAQKAPKAAPAAKEEKKEKPKKEPKEQKPKEEQHGQSALLARPWLST